MDKKNIGRRKKIIVAAAGFIAVAACCFFLLNQCTEKNAVQVPDYPKVDLEKEINSRNLSEEQYELLFMQTGLGKPAVDKVLADSMYKDRLKRYQEDFFHPDRYECQRIGIITREERVRDEEGKTKPGFALADVKDGDIFLTSATHSLNWRHGHAAIVIDEEKGRTVEAVLWGEPSMVQPVRKWRTYPTMIQLRVKQEVAEKLGYDQRTLGKSLAQFAEENMENVDYTLLTGLPKKAPEEISRTQCAHLAWYTYYQFGMDIDSDGTWLVTPKDIANSPLLEVVQVYGVNPKEVWN